MAPLLVAALLAALALTVALEDDGEACADEVQLLQTPGRPVRPGLQPPWWCYGYPATTDSQCSSILPKLGKSKTLGWWDMPKQDLSAIADSVTPFTNFTPSGSVKDFLEDTTWGLAKASDAPKLMYEATKVSGFEDVPEFLRGVFWMKGNGVAEELTVLQYGKWFKEEGIYVAVMAPLMWAWPAGMPEDAPYSGAMYSDSPSAGMTSASFLMSLEGAFSYKFSECPSYAACHGKDSLGNMSFAYMQVHNQSRLGTAAMNLGDMLTAPLPGMPSGIANGVFTLETNPDAAGTNWRRQIRWGLGESCANINIGSYNLQRILDGEGNPVKPNFDDFVSYMGDIELLLWTGFKNDTVRNERAQKHSESNAAR